MSPTQQLINCQSSTPLPHLPRCSWLAAELGRLLCAPEASGQQQDPEPAASANDAMAAFAAALPADTLLQQVQQAAWEAGTLNAQRAAALLATAAQQKPTTGQSIECWVAEQATAALQQHAAGPLRSFVMLQRALLLQQSNPSTHLPGQQADVQQSAQQRYRAWFAATLLAPEQQPLIQYLVNQLLIPLLPEEEATWLQAQADVLSALLRLAHPQQQQAPLVAGSAQAAEEYLEAAKQRLKGLQQQAAAAGVQQGEQASDLGASRTNLQRGQLVVAALLKVGGVGWRQVAVAAVRCGLHALRLGVAFLRMSLPLPTLLLTTPSIPPCPAGVCGGEGPAAQLHAGTDASQGVMWGDVVCVGVSVSHCYASQALMASYA